MVGTTTRRAIRSVIGARTRAREWLSETLAGEPSADDVYVRSMFLALRRRARDRHEVWRPQYGWSVLCAARIARSLGVARISVLELGVAGGNGLRALETAADGAEALFGIGIDVLGFDMGTGLPAPSDRRDAPFALRGGDFRMDEAALRAHLRRAELVVGPAHESIGTFLAREPSPIGFVAFDLDYYSSTMEAFAVLEAEPDRLLPRVICCFDDVLWYPWTDFNGERAAIADFNSRHEHRKISPLRGLRYALPRSEFKLPWPELVHVAELFDHPRYAAPEGARLPDLSLRL
jgi:hypothetical protein